MPMPFLKRKFVAISRLSNCAISWKRAAISGKACCDGISVANELHSYFQCGLYADLRRVWISKLNVPANFHELSAAEKFQLIFNKPENVKTTAQYIIDAFNKRSKIVNA